MTSEGATRRGLITGWNKDGACPDVRPGTTSRSIQSCRVDPNTGEVTVIPRTNRLVHGESKVAGIYGGRLASPIRRTGRAMTTIRPPSVFRRITPGELTTLQALHLAEYQTAHEWCRLLHLAKDSEYGYAASSILMTLWASPHGRTRRTASDHDGMRNASRSVRRQTGPHRGDDRPAGSCLARAAPPSVPRPPDRPESRSAEAPGICALHG